MRLSKTGLYITYLIIFVFMISGSVLFNGCKSKVTNSFKATGDTVADGKILVQMYCTKCHQEVPVNALTKDVWVYHTLPTMSHRLGLSTYGIDYFVNNPDSTAITLSNWAIIVAYYRKWPPLRLMQRSHRLH